MESRGSNVQLKHGRTYVRQSCFCSHSTRTKAVRGSGQKASANMTGVERARIARAYYAAIF
jgi:hypothetical protein